MPQEHPDIKLYSKDIRDIFGTMPHWLLQWHIAAIAINTLFILIGRWFFWKSQLASSSGESFYEFK